MPIVNFAIPKTLEQRLQQTIKKKGFNSRAEFFRFSAIYFMDVIDSPNTENERFDYLTKSLTQEIKQKYSDEKIPSIEEQLKISNALDRNFNSLWSSIETFD